MYSYPDNEQVLLRLSRSELTAAGWGWLTAPARGGIHRHDRRHREPTSLRYALRRLGFFILTLWAALTLNFLLPRLMPGNPALAMLGKFHGELSPKALNALEILFGVNSHQSLISSTSATCTSS